MITITAFFESLRVIAPGFIPAIEDHIKFNGEILPHLLMADLQRIVASYFNGNRTTAAAIPAKAELKKVLELLDEFMQTGDEETTNAIAVSFLEGIWEEPYYKLLQPHLGPALRTEIENQIEHRAG